MAVKTALIDWVVFALQRELDGDMAMKCEKCGSETLMQVQAVISAPSRLAHKFSKSNLRERDVQLLGVLWETADYICTNPNCGFVIDGFGNYVTALEKEIERLKETYEPLYLKIESNYQRISRKAR